MSKYPDGPRDWFFGATMAMRFRRAPLEFIREVCGTYGDIAYFRMGPIRAYFVNNPQWIREVLVAKHKSFRRPRWLTQPLAKVDGNGLVLSEGDLWQRQRRLVQPAFSTRRFDRYAQVTVDFTRRAIDRWNSTAPIDISAEMTRLTLEIIAKTLFDVEVAAQVDTLGHAVRVVSECFVKEAGNPLQLPDWLPLPGKLRQRRAIATLDELIWNILRRRRAARDDRGDLLSMLLLAVDEEGDGRGMTDQQARDEAITLFNAGHDSTAAALAWIWYLVASHADVESRLIEEVDSVLRGRAATYADVPRLPYVEMVVKESLRLYPPTWTLFAREAIGPVELGGYTIPRGAWVYTFPYVTHRDPRFFENPEMFDPLRFSPGRVEKIPPYAYFPFGGGPRVCIGSAFATMEMILIVATGLQRFRVTLAESQRPVVPEALISLRPKGGLRVSLAARNEPACVGQP
jgi:cytochrome P450